jgi:hypothetical protein
VNSAARFTARGDRGRGEARPSVFQRIIRRGRVRLDGPPLTRHDQIQRGRFSHDARESAHNDLVAVGVLTDHLDAHLSAVGQS